MGGAIGFDGGGGFEKNRWMGGGRPPLREILVAGTYLRTMIIIFLQSICYSIHFAFRRYYFISSRLLGFKIRSLNLKVTSAAEIFSVIITHP